MMADWVMVTLTAVYVIATIFICYFNYCSTKASREQTAEMKHQYDMENRPYITIELIYERKAFFGLRFSNHGKRIANHVKIQLEQDFLDSIIEPDFRSLLEKEKGRECIIGIGQHYDLYFGTNKFRDNPSKYAVSGSITYTDEKKSYNNDFSIDFEKYAAFFSVNSDFDDFMKEVKTQSKELKQINAALTYITSNIAE